MKITPIPELKGYGVFVDDIDIKKLTRDQWMSLGKLQMEQLVMIIRNTGININHFHKVMKMWGKCRQNYAAKVEHSSDVANEYAMIGCLSKS